MDTEATKLPREHLARDLSRYAEAEDPITKDRLLRRMVNTLQESIMPGLSDQEAQDKILDLVRGDVRAISLLILV